MNIRVATTVIIGLTMVGGFFAAIGAQERTVWDGVYTCLLYTSPSPRD